MSVLIPSVRIADLQIRPRLFSGNQEGALGGEDLPIPRMGDRFAVDIATSQLRQDDESRELIAALFAASTADARIELRLPNVPDASGFGVAVVNGGGQTGSTLGLRSVTPRALVHRGAFFSMLHNGFYYLHMVSALAQADADGKIDVPIWPMLRFVTTDGDGCQFGVPIIEGQLIGMDKGAGFERNRTKPLSFTIQERR